ncbi:L-threonine 3-dehydrogenase [Candidatus Atribacteria bacterium 1244-E10-H5-B2]|nr:MAG: L-threonine 3-dehydrogenase [Candidatus Atribacteria bacterium 1244-E10-H5-B2]
MKAYQILKPRIIKELVLDKQKMMNPPQGWITIRVNASGICGTDIHIFLGEYLGDYPIIPGHEFSGDVVAIGDKVDKFQIGDRVAIEPNLSCGICDACLHNRQHFCENWQGIGVTMSGGMATHVMVPQQSAFTIGDLSFEEAAFMEPLSCVIHGVGLIGSALGTHTLLIGVGPIGMLLLRTLKNIGTVELDIVEKNKSRRNFAAAERTGQVFSDFSQVKKEHYDIVVDATGVISVLEQCITFARPAGKILFFRVPPRGKVMTIEPFRLFNKELTIMSSYTSLRNSKQAIDLISVGRIVVKDLISHRLPLNELEGGLRLILDGKVPSMKVMIFPQM